MLFKLSLKSIFRKSLKHDVQFQISAFLILIMYSIPELEYYVIYKLNNLFHCVRKSSSYHVISIIKRDEIVRVPFRTLHS